LFHRDGRTDISVGILSFHRTSREVLVGSFSLNVKDDTNILLAPDVFFRLGYYPTYCTRLQAMRGRRQTTSVLLQCSTDLPRVHLFVKNLACTGHENIY
jgi:hypothetical protein